MTSIYNEFRTKLTQAFKSFDQEELQTYKKLTEASNDESKSRDAEIRRAPTHNNFIGSGRECDTYKLEDGNHCAKVYVESRGNENIENKVRAMHEAQVNNCDQKLSKIKAINLDDGILIQELAKGKAPEHLSELDFDQITKQQFLDLMNNLDKLFKIKVDVDLTEGNIFYDPNEGFSLIDFDYYNLDSETMDKEKIVEYLRDELLEVLKINTNKHSEYLESRFEEASQDFLKAN